MIALAALDIAGTTIDEGGTVYRVLARVVADHGAPAADADIRRWMGADKREALAALTGADPDVVEDLHTRFAATLTDAYSATPPVPFPGVPAALRALRDVGIAVVLTTGFDRQVADPLLAAVGWRPGIEVDAVVCAVEAGAGRPAPAMIEHAMALTGVTDPGKVLAAGDTVLDVAAGRAARARHVVGVLTGAQTRRELESAGPTAVVDGVTDLPTLLGLSTGAHP